jgi:hypothetical protein
MSETPDHTLIKEKYKVSLIEKHILLIEVNDFEIFEIEDLLVLRKWIIDSIPEKRLFNLFQFGIGSSLSKELREYAASNEGAQRTSGTAILVKNLAQQLLVDYYLKINKPIYPTRAFYKKEKAIEWINDHLENN